MLCDLVHDKPDPVHGSGDAGLPGLAQVSVDVLHGDVREACFFQALTHFRRIRKVRRRGGGLIRRLLDSHAFNQPRIQLAPPPDSLQVVANCRFLPQADSEKNLVAVNRAEGRDLEPQLRQKRAHVGEDRNARVGFRGGGLLPLHQQRLKWRVSQPRPGVLHDEVSVQLLPLQDLRAVVVEVLRVVEDHHDVRGGGVRSTQTGEELGPGVTQPAEPGLLPGAAGIQIPAHGRQVILPVSAVHESEIEHEPQRHQGHQGHADPNQGRVVHHPREEGAEKALVGALTAGGSILDLSRDALHLVTQPVHRVHSPTLATPASTEPGSITLLATLTQTPVLVLLCLFQVPVIRALRGGRLCCGVPEARG
mmetsp:Transcript_2339/g.5291  ORF Transcript_2339/g.5291 Transcript_2339/m.5291 type:complete len:364 (+) Transcript_2339:917-2008(+)